MPRVKQCAANALNVSILAKKLKVTPTFLGPLRDFNATRRKEKHAWVEMHKWEKRSGETLPEVKYKPMQ